MAKAFYARSSVRCSINRPCPSQRSPQKCAPATQQLETATSGDLANFRFFLQTRSQGPRITVPPPIFPFQHIF